MRMLQHGKNLDGVFTVNNAMSRGFDNHLALLIISKNYKNAPTLKKPRS